MNVELPETLVIIESIVYKSNGFAIVVSSKNPDNEVEANFTPQGRT